ncbi:large ribosomal subunit protein mL51 [Amia ocellicauda]|uniref:large ribosomal subunit protein mL51 n=1 Tax=Amia ocellicauda TaxID=2972642 RepID=UPI003464772B
MSVLLGSVWRAGVSLFKPTLQTGRQISTGVCSRVRMHAIPLPKQTDRWNEKRSVYGLYDNVGILGDFKAHPRDLIVAPRWLKGFRGNELQRCIRKKQMVGDRMMTSDLHSLEKRISFLYRHFNRYGKHR